MKTLDLTLTIVLLLAAIPALAEETATIVIRPSLAPEERARRAAEEELRRETVRRDLALWRSRHEPAVRPLRRALGEAVESLRLAQGPYSRNLGYAVKLAVEELRARTLPPLPAPELENEMRQALAEIEQAADLCLEGRLTTAQLQLLAGRDRLERSLAPQEESFAPHRLFERPPCGPGCAGTARVGKKSRQEGTKENEAGRGRSGSRKPMEVPRLPTLRKRKVSG